MNLSDYAKDAIDAGAAPDNMDACAYCGTLYDPDHEGHTDEATGLSFCDAPCEMHYDQESRLPQEYKRA